MIEVVTRSTAERLDGGARLRALRAIWGFLVSLAAFWGTEAGRALRTRARPMRAETGWSLDLLHAVRSLRRAPGFLALSVVMMTLAVAANTTIFATVHQTLLRPLPFPKPDRLMLVWGSNAANGQVRDVVAGPNYLDQRRENVTFEALAAFSESGVILMEDGRPSIVHGLEATVDMAAVLAVDPHLGRWFDESEGFSTGPAAIMLGYDFWQRRFGGDPGVLGSRLELQDQPRTVVGILPPDLYLPWSTDVLIPIPEDVLAQASRTSYHYWLLGRLRDGVSLSEADRDLDAIMDRIGLEDPRLSDWDARVEPFQTTVTEPVRPALYALLAGVGLVLLITAANLANLLLVRGTTRSTEMAVRSALGARRSRIVRQLLFEGGIIGGLGAVGGVVCAALLIGVLPSLTPQTVNIGNSAASVEALRWSLSSVSVAFGLALGLITGLALALPVALRGAGAGRGLMSPGLRVTEGRGRRRGRDLLVISELALATVLLAMAGLSVRASARLLAVDPGLRTDGVLSLHLGNLQDASPEERASIFRRVLVEVASVPGVVSVGLNDYVPFEGEDDFQGMHVEGRAPPAPGDGIREEWRRISHEFLEAAGLEVVRGRGFVALDDVDEAASVALVNEAFARKHFPGEDPVGQRITVHHSAYALTEIVGVVGDVRARGLDRPAPPTFYSPFHRGPRPSMALFIRSEGDPSAWIESVKEAVWRVDAGMPMDGAMALRQVLDTSLGVRRLTLQLVSGLAAVALLLASLGVFGVTAFSVRMRRKEMGVRLALGASPSAVRRMVLVHGLTLSAAGLSVGVLGALLAGRASAGLWYGVGGFDAPSLAVALIALVVAGVAASLLPAIQASRTDPVASLAGD